MTVASQPSHVLAGRYRLDAPLGQRSDGWFCQAHDLVLGRPVTVKMFRATVDDAAARTFAVQAKALVGLRHARLVALHDGGVADGHPYLVLEPFDGFDSVDATCEEPLTAADTAILGAGLADALARMHETGIVHGNLTLASVLIDANGQRRLVGLGFGGVEDNTPSADVHALGVVLLQCLSGQDAAEPSGSIPWPLARVLTAMTGLDPARRPSAAVAAQRLGRAATTLETGRWSPSAAAVQRARMTGLALVGGLVTVGVIAVAPAFWPQQAMPPAAAPVPTTSPRLPLPDPTATATSQGPVSYPSPTTGVRPTTSAHPTTDTQPSTVSADPTSAAPTTTTKVPPGLAKKPGGQPPGLFKKLFHDHDGLGWLFDW